ncbi:MAG TPA: hypothetical protein VHY08_17120 [Bacillota bacterium]|nr:hypothetical protein [Bacillota bacterium]
MYSTLESLLGGDFYLPELLVDSYIIPAVQKPGKLKPNPNSAKKLADIIKAVGQAPSAQPIPPMPEIAARIAGKRFKLEDSSSISLVFKDGKECWLNLFSNGTQYDFSVGLDGVFRIADAKDWGSLPAHNWIACKGAWMDEQTFMITFRELGDVGEIQEYYTFDGNQITIKTFSKIADTYIWENKGVMEQDSQD